LNLKLESIKEEINRVVSN